MFKLVVLISGRGSNMKAIVNARDYMQAEVVAVISDKPDARGLMFAGEKKIPVHVIPADDNFDDKLARTIDDYRPDLLVLAGFMRILSAEFVAKYRGRIINIHPSLLPAYKGLDTHKRVIAAGEQEHGASVHFVTEQLDSGKIIRQVKVKVLPNDTEDSLARRVLTEEHKLYPKAIREVLTSGLAVEREISKNA